MKSLIIALLVTFTGGAFASGTMMLEGTVRSFTADMIELTDGQKVYKLDRKKIMQPIGKVKTGDKLALNVPFEAITGVRPQAK